MIQIFFFISRTFNEDILLHFQPKVIFREYFVLPDKRKIFQKSIIQKVFKKLIVHINNFQNLSTN